MMEKVVANLIENGEHSMVRRMKKVVAFDTRFNLFCDNIKCLYLLDVPIYDKNYEVVYQDGTKKLLSDKEATELLRKERDFNANIKDKANDQLKRISKFSRMGDIQLDPTEPEEVKEVREELDKPAPQLETE